MRKQKTMKQILDRLNLALLGSADSQAVRHRGRRALVLAAAIGVPAFAAPADWVSSDINESAANELALAKAMPFEQPGMSFPGSAFYYLENAPEYALALPALDPNDATVDSNLLGQRIDVGPSARPFVSAGTGIDKARALRCLTQAVYYEAASESDAGQRAVAQVVLNRAAHTAWPASICGVVFEGSQRRTGCQFSFTCDGSMARKPARKAWDRAQNVAARALAGDVYAPVGLATHYHTNWVNPYWAKTLDHVGTIGAHRFYRSRGSAGKPAAFHLTYRGGESPAPALARRAEARSITTQLEAIPAAIEFEHAETIQSTTAKPDEASESLPFASAGQVKERYARSGQWKSEPGQTATQNPQ